MGKFLYATAKKLGCKICPECKKLINSDGMVELKGVASLRRVGLTPQMWTKDGNVFHATIEVVCGNHYVTLVVCGNGKVCKR